MSSIFFFFSSSLLNVTLILMIKISLLTKSKHLRKKEKNKDPIDWLYPLAYWINPLADWLNPPAD